jgi:Methane oxygenase PmoA
MFMNATNHALFTKSLTLLTGAVLTIGACGAHAQSGVSVKAAGTEVEVKVDGALFTRYTMQCAPNKPIFYPILNADGNHFTRRWPVEPNAVPGESTDHPHHRGLWFTHSKVNGVDFWSEQGTVGKTITTKISGVKSGPAKGGFTAETEWHLPTGELIAKDRRVITIQTLPDGGRILDFEITITPTAGPLLFGDNKDGVFGLRVPDSLAINPAVKPKVAGTGHILNSNGVKDTDAWGKHADWVDYWGPISGTTWGVAIFDAPTNFRHPQTWHARDYSLFTVNPFGLHDFNLGDKGAGDLTVPADGKLHALYRVYFHKGDAMAAHVAENYALFAREHAKK